LKTRGALRLWIKRRSDSAGRLDVADVRQQIAWYREHGYLKNPIDGDTVIDKRFVVPMPGK
jgi:hypothetical protein